MKPLISHMMFVSASLLVNPVSAETCPVPSTSIKPIVEVVVNFDKKTKLYTYRYKVKNEKQAKVGIDYFALETPQGPAVSNLKGWKQKFNPAHRSYPNYVSWLQLLNEILPGKEQDGFEIKSNFSPGEVRYYVDGYTEGVLSMSEDTGETQECPGFYHDAATTLEGMVTGVTIGPVSDNRTELKMRMIVRRDNSKQKPVDEDEPTISPIEKGKVELVIFSDREGGVDVAKINTKSIGFGPGQAAPLRSRLLPSNEHKRWRFPFFKRVPRILWMEFNLADLKIRCDLDKALFLKGKMGEAAKPDKQTDVYGSIKMKPTICTPDTWKKMRAERKHGK